MIPKVERKKNMANYTHNHSTMPSYSQILKSIPYIASYFYTVGQCGTQILLVDALMDCICKTN